MYEYLIVLGCSLAINVWLCIVIRMQRRYMLKMHQVHLVNLRHLASASVIQDMLTYEILEQCFNGNSCLDRIEKHLEKQAQQRVETST